MNAFHVIKNVVLLLGLVILALGTPAVLADTGNGAPNGAHYNLNILGKDNCPGDDLKNTNRHTIMVKLNFTDPTPTTTSTAALDKTNKIFLTQTPLNVTKFSDKFQVLDGNACDGDGALFMLPSNPFSCGLTIGGTNSTDPACLTVDTDITFQEYLIFIRELGKPGAPNSSLTSCRLDTSVTPNETICSTEGVILSRTTGKSTFRDVTKELTTLCLNTNTANGNDCDVRVGIFDGTGFQYFWDFDNNGLRNVQLRFYPCPDAGNGCTVLP